MSQWFRFYERTLDNPKAQRLPGETFKGWVNLLCLAKRHGGKIPAIADVAFALRMAEAKARILLETLSDAGLLDVTEAGTVPHDWSEHQYDSDSAAERMRRHRERNKKHNSDAQRDVTVTSPVTTPLRARADTEQNRTESEQKEPPIAPPKGAEAVEPADERKRTRGSRIPADWEPSPEAIGRGQREGYSLLETEWLAERFKLFWTGVSGAKGCKADWDRTFQNYLGGAIARRDVEARRRGVSAPGARLGGLAAAAADRAKRRRDRVGDGVGHGGGNDQGGFADGAIVIDGCVEPVPGGDGGLGVGPAVDGDEAAEPGQCGVDAGGIRPAAA